MKKGVGLVIRIKINSVVLNADSLQTSDLEEIQAEERRQEVPVWELHIPPPHTGRALLESRGFAREKAVAMCLFVRIHFPHCTGTPDSEQAPIVYQLGNSNYVSRG